MSWQTPVTDRTAEDVANRTPKGFFNVADWLRIHGNAELVKALIEVVYGVEIDPSTLTAPTITKVPTVEEFNAFLEFIDMNPHADFIGMTMTEITTEYTAGAGGTSPDYEDANTWENNIQLIRKFIHDNLHFMPCCGVFGAGQPTVWQVRFRTWAFIEPVASPVRRSRCGVSLTGSGLTRTNGFRRY